MKKSFERFAFINGLVRPDVESSMGHDFYQDDLGTAYSSSYDNFDGGLEQDGWQDTSPQLMDEATYFEMAREGGFDKDAVANWVMYNICVLGRTEEELATEASATSGQQISVWEIVEARNNAVEMLNMQEAVDEMEESSDERNFHEAWVVEMISPENIEVLKHGLKIDVTREQEFIDFLTDEMPLLELEALYLKHIKGLSKAEAVSKLGLRDEAELKQFYSYVVSKVLDKADDLEKGMANTHDASNTITDEYENNLNHQRERVRTFAA